MKDSNRNQPFIYKADQIIDFYYGKFRCQKVRPVVMMLCATWYHLYNLKNVKNIHGGVILLEVVGFSLLLYKKYHSSMGVFHVIF